MWQERSGRRERNGELIVKKTLLKGTLLKHVSISTTYFRHNKHDHAHWLLVFVIISVGDEPHTADIFKMFAICCLIQKFCLYEFIRFKI